MAGEIAGRCDKREAEVRPDPDRNHVLFQTFPQPDTAFDKADFRNVVPRFTSENRSANQRLLDEISGIAATKGVPMAQIALAWVLARKPWIVPIPGTTRQHRLTENLGAARVELSAAELASIQSILNTVEIQGERYPAALAARAAR
jgi:aryl-alcohol dehydrogenase-like predicted oxidoreductase